MVKWLERPVSEQRAEVWIKVRRYVMLKMTQYSSKQSFRRVQVMVLCSMPVRVSSNADTAVENTRTVFIEAYLQLASELHLNICLNVIK